MGMSLRALVVLAVESGGCLGAQGALPQGSVCKGPLLQGLSDAWRGAGPYG